MEAVYPPVCYACGELFDSPADRSTTDMDRPDARTFAGLMAPWLCPICAGKFTPIDPPLCTTCGEVFKSRTTRDHVCGRCRRGDRFFQTARAAGIYEQSLMTVLQQLKYAGRVELAAPLGDLLADALMKWFDPAGIDMIVPVPLHIRKQRQRGFNQTWLLIRHWTRPDRQGRMPVFADKIFRNLLVRTRSTRSQTKLTRRERQANIRGAFALSDPARVNGRTVLLIDDVFTTGATVNECARVLTAAGAARVDVLTTARVR